MLMARCEFKLDLKVINSPFFSVVKTWDKQLLHCVLSEQITELLLYIYKLYNDSIINLVLISPILMGLI